MAAIAGIRGTGDWGADERPKNFRELIMFRQPNGTAPLFALLAKAGKETVDDYDFSWWDEPITITRLQINMSGGAGSTVTTLIVDSADPGVSTPEVPWGLAKHLAPNDVLMYEPATESVSNFAATEYVRVVQVIDDNTIQVQRGFAGSTAATIADDGFLLRVGSAHADGSDAPKASSRKPVKYGNLTQIFKTTYDVTGRALVTKTRTGDVLANEKKRRTTDHSMQIELAFMFGRKSETTDDNGQVVSTTDGLRRQIPTVTSTVFTAAVTFTGATNNFLDAAYKVFDWETGAGMSRICFCGNGALIELNKIVAKDTNSEVQFGQVIKLYGMELRELILPQGTFYLRTHPLMNRHTVYTKSMFITDFSAIKYRPMKERDTKAYDDIQNKGEDAKRGYWMTDAGLSVHYAGLTQGYLGNISAT